MTYIKRNLEDNIQKLLSFFPVVLVIGSRQAGKTTLVKKCATDWTYFNLETGKDFDYVTRDWDFFFEQHKDKVIFDEAQECPELFSELKLWVDKKREKKGRFLLTGSSSPELMKNVSESLAGRVGILELGTLKMNERFLKPLSEFYKIFKKPLHYEKDFSFSKTWKLLKVTFGRFF